MVELLEEIVRVVGKEELFCVIIVGRTLELDVALLVGGMKLLEIVTGKALLTFRVELPEIVDIMLELGALNLVLLETFPTVEGPLLKFEETCEIAEDTVKRLEVVIEYESALVSETVEEGATDVDGLISILDEEFAYMVGWKERAVKENAGCVITAFFEKSEQEDACNDIISHFFPIFENRTTTHDQGQAPILESKCWEGTRRRPCEAWHLSQHKT